jgi:formate dehydrogenase
VAIYANCHANAMQRRESLLRTLGEAWAQADPFALAEEIFRRILAHPEGVEVARTDPTDSLTQYIGYDDKKIRIAPPEMVGEMGRAMEASLRVDEAYPFVLANGLRTRWTANTIQRDPSWRKGQGPHCELHLCPGDAAELGIVAGDAVRIETRRSAIVLPAAIDVKLRPGHVWMPNGFGVQYASTDGKPAIQGANGNEITDAADRDPFTGCPHHRYVPVRLSRVAQANAAA